MMVAQGGQPRMMMVPQRPGMGPNMVPMQQMNPAMMPPQMSPNGMMAPNGMFANGVRSPPPQQPQQMMGGPRMAMAMPPNSGGARPMGPQGYVQIPARPGFPPQQMPPQGFPPQQMQQQQQMPQPPPRKGPEG